MWAGDFNRNRAGAPSMCCKVRRKFLCHRYTAPKSGGDPRAARLPTECIIGQCQLRNSGWQKWMHSTGKSLRSSCMVMNSGWMSAQNSCSGSLHASALTPVSGSVPSGKWASYPRTPRKLGSSARSSNKMVVPVRGGPDTNTGAATSAARASGLARQ